MNFTIASDDFGFTQNTGDYFRGDKIVSMHNPGSFPRVVNQDNLDMLNVDWASLQYVNGGIPQEGDLEDHYKELRMQLREDIPDPSFSGK